MPVGKRPGRLPVRTETRPVRIRMVPYFAWNNRGEPQMTVWMPLKQGP